MLYKEKNELGVVGFSKAVVARIAAEAANSYPGKVFLSNSKGKIPARTKPAVTGQINCIGVELSEAGLEIKVYIIVRFGTSIAMVCHGIIDAIQKQVPEMTGLVPESIVVYVTGVSVGKRIVKRNLEVRSGAAQ